MLENSSGGQLDRSGRCSALCCLLCPAFPGLRNTALVREHPFHAFPEIRTVVVVVKVAKLVDHHVVHNAVGCDDDLPVEQQVASMK